MADVANIIQQLNSARDIVLRDAAIYPQVVPGVLAVIAPTQPLPLRRWGADFLAETFASPVVSTDSKQKMCLGVLDTLKGYLLRKELMGTEEDVSVAKSAIQCAASVYPLVFRHALSQREDADSWTTMMSIKSSILRRMDTAAAGVRICCLKFVARVVQVQTYGVIAVADPRRQDQNEISLALVPRDHPLLVPSNLEAEATGLLDRLLGALQDNSTDALLVTATLNSLSTLVQHRPSISNKILNIVCTFNPLSLSSNAMSGTDRVAIKSMARTTSSFVVNVLKRNPSHPLASRLQQHNERLRRSLHGVFSEQNLLKRSAPDEPTDGLDDSKRQRLNAEADEGTASQQNPGVGSLRLPPGPVSFAQLFTLSQDAGAVAFHAEALPVHIVAQLVQALLVGIDQNRLAQTLNAVSSRYLEVERRSALQATRPDARGGDDDDDDFYSPEDEFGGDGDMRRSSLVEGATLDLGPFHLPPSPPLTEEERNEYSDQTLERVFETLVKLDKDGKGKLKLGGERGFNRVASVAQDRDGWMTLLTRLATRPTFDLDDSVTIKPEPNDDDNVAKINRHPYLPAKLREAFHKYVADDHRHRIDFAITWLNEEWYADTLSARRAASASPDTDLSTPISGNYDASLTALLDSMALFIDRQDLKILIRFLSEIPALPAPVFTWLARLADDPERVQIVCGALQYLVMFRPPARADALDCVAALHRDNADARKGCEKILKTWRPAALEEVAGQKLEAKVEA